MADQLDALESILVRLQARLLGIATRIEAQADCLDQYAEAAGHPRKPVPSVFHLQAMHFRDLAAEVREVADD